MRSLKRLYGAAVLAGAMVVMQAPAEAQRLDALQLAANTKAETATHKTIQPVKSLPPRKRSRCYG